MRRLFKAGPHSIHANLTPLIDVTFLLIVFFMLVLQITDLDHVDMALDHDVGTHDGRVQRRRARPVHEHQLQAEGPVRCDARVSRQRSGRCLSPQ